MPLWRHVFETNLREAMGKNLHLVWTNNRRVMISFNSKKRPPTLRLHESFATADRKLQQDLIRFLSIGGQAPESVREFVNRIAAQKREPENLVTIGKKYNLRTIYKKINNTCFGGRLKGKITWGKKAFSGQKRSITFGSYFAARKLIRIHPVLDTELVPPFYLESVVHHEMVHEYMDTVEGCGGKRGEVHSKRFRELERGFRYFELAVAWEKRHLQKLLRYRPQLRK